MQEYQGKKGIVFLITYSMRITNGQTQAQYDDCFVIKAL